MTNFKLYGFTEEDVRKVRGALRNLFMRDPEFKNMIVTVINSTTENLKDGIPLPYIEVADSDINRGSRIADKLSEHLKKDVECTWIVKFVPTDAEVE